MLQIPLINHVLVALVYHSPKANKDFISEFSELLSKLATQFNRFFYFQGTSMYIYVVATMQFLKSF